MGPTGVEDEAVLVDRARAGDADAWEILYRRAHPRLVAYARRRLATPEQAEEAVSETVARAMDRIGDYRPGAAGITPWLFGIARNVVLETYRAGRRHHLTDPAALPAALPGARSGDQHREHDPEALVLSSEERRLVADAFGRLSPADQDVLGLRVLGGLPADRVAELTGRRAGAVRTAQSRALARLRTQFAALSA